MQNKKNLIVLLPLFVVSTAYDFWRGYRETLSVGGGLVYVLIGFGVLGFFLWLYHRFHTKPITKVNR
jgi:hypothetical protein